MSTAHRPKMVAVGGACATSIYRVDAVPPLPAKALANALCRVADGMAISAACGFTRLGGDIAPREVLARLVPLADFAVFSDAGLLAYTGSSDVAAALVHVAASHDGHVGATCGRDGYAWCERGLLRRVPAPAVEVDAARGAGVGG